MSIRSCFGVPARPIGFCLAAAVWASSPALALVDQDLLEDPAPSPVSVTLTPVATGLNALYDGATVQYFGSDMAPFPDGSGRLAVLTLGGVVRVVDSGGTLEPTAYAVLVNANTQIEPGNYGFSSIAFHPGFADAGDPGFGKFYVIEPEDPDIVVPDFDGSLLQEAFGGRHHDVLVEYTASDPSAGVFSGSRREIMRVEQPGFDHNMFDLAFVEDNGVDLLYITLGDGGNQGESVSPIRDNPTFLGNVFGKVLRIDPLGNNSANGAYGIPASNPFVGTAGALGEIFTIGHRAPYRMNVDRATGDLWVGEVGQRQVEEVNVLAAGADYGWASKEGSFLFDQTDHDNTSPDVDMDMNGTGDFADTNGLTDPVFELDHETMRSITGGFVYRGEEIPVLQGRYLFAGALTQGLYFGDPGNGPVAGSNGGVQELAISGDGVGAPFGTISIGEDADGELYLLTFDGRLLRIDANPCSGADLNADSMLDFADVSRFLGYFGTGDLRADLDASGVLDFGDVSAFLSLFAAGCP